VGLAGFESLIGHQLGKIQTFLNGEFHFMQQVRDDSKNIFDAQCTKAAFQSRLFTMVPTSNVGFLAHSNKIYRLNHAKESSIVDKKLKACKIVRVPEEPENDEEKDSNVYTPEFSKTSSNVKIRKTNLNVQVKSNSFEIMH